jgi:NADPH-dependent 2,4-dienoyl-CoA reductase/sulfur reductase-like enzyme
MSSRERSVAIVGAGPAGMGAAVEAGGAGALVTLIDSGSRWGGQYWRHRRSLQSDPDLYHDMQVYEGLSRRLHELQDSGRLRHLPSHHVWAVRADERGVQVSAVDRTDPEQLVEVTVDADRLILATGTYDRPVPFPGWDLPGVMTVGAAQALLKGSGVLVGRRVLVAGTGPFLLPVAAALVKRGATVVGVHEANHPLGWLPHMRAVVSVPARIGEATGYLATLARHGIRVRNRSMVVAAHGTDQVESVTTVRLDRDGNPRAGTEREHEVDTVAVSYGFAIQSELPLQVGCAMDVTSDGTLATTIDEVQATTMQHVYAVGETTGIGGAREALLEGRIAGTHAAGVIVGADLLASRNNQRRFGAAINDVYPVPHAWMSALESDTVVCRCEEVTVGEIDAALALGARDTRTVKLLSRSGMGWCQGRECGYATACLIGRRINRPPDLASGAERPVAAPIPLGAISRPAESTTTGKKIN